MEPRPFADLSIFLRTSLGRTLVLADPHIGFEISRGLRVRTHYEEELASFIRESDPDALIILGDVKEPLGMGTELRRMLSGFFSAIGDRKIYITKGNHDGRIEGVAERFGVKVVPYLLLDDLLFLHGHTLLPALEFREAFLGHIHPAYRVKGTGKLTKVYLRVGRFLILSTVNPYLEGFDIKLGIKMIPFLKKAEVGDVFLPEGIYIGRVSLKNGGKSGELRPHRA